MRHVTVVNASKGRNIGSKIVLADTLLSRLVGLLGKRRLEAGSGVLLSPSSGVHTIGMLFAIDVVALDKNLRVLRVWPRLRPLRITRLSWKTHSVLELAAGEIGRCDIAPGDQLELRD